MLNQTPVPVAQVPTWEDSGQKTQVKPNHNVVGYRTLNGAQGFRTGMTPDGYVLSALELIMSRFSSSSATMSDLTVTLRNASGNNPGSRWFSQRSLTRILPH